MMADGMNPDVATVLPILRRSVALWSGAAAPQYVALAAVIAGAEAFGELHGMEAVASWLRAMADTFEHAHPVERPADVRIN